MRHFLDLRGERFGRLVAMEIDISSMGKRTKRKCLCDCGEVITVILSNLRKGTSNSCGCLQKEQFSKRNFKHGMTDTRIFNIWNGIKQRCGNVKFKQYKDYGGRGVKNLRKTFEEFKNDMYDSYLDHVKKYGEKQTTIDRIDNNGNYCKENCRRSTYKEQANNKR